MISVATVESVETLLKAGRSPRTVAYLLDLDPRTVEKVAAGRHARQRRAGDERVQRASPSRGRGKHRCPECGHLFREPLQEAECWECQMIRQTTNRRRTL